ncbi:hypothetical protein Poly41_38700 [Novipirellula artificiosorum]|uniref:Methyltransferase domain-containing protein n=2 Tax=Novipirellula artificiosorum TaxID=2528016 RepID=A0A5C6DJN5_9BACT|nr:hypothetical protein Poly41_38700 [Novipirellula artificiosorum]
MPLNRVRQLEWMDDPSLPESDRRWALAGLSRINRLSGVADVLLHQLQHYARSLPERPLRVLDLASGEGDLPIHWALKAKLANAKHADWDLCVTASDSCDRAIEQQQRRAEQAGVGIRSLQMDCLNVPLPSGFDVIVCSLLMHQLDESQVFRLLQAMQLASTRAMLVCDFERTRWNLAIIKTASHLLTRSPVFHHDSAISVKSAFTREEFARIARAALTRPVRIRSVVPCRFMMVADESVVPVVSPVFA